MEDERRNALRVHLDIPVTVLDNTGNITLRATGISPRGMFIKTDLPSPLRRLIRIRVPITADGKEMQVLAMVVHRVLPAQSKAAKSPPGMGVQLYGLGPAAHQRWIEWVDELSAATLQPIPQAGDPPPPPVHSIAGHPPPIDAIKRRHPRYQVQWEVRIISDDVETTSTRDISASGAFVYTKGTYPPSSVLDVVLIHPDTGEGFDTPARVIRRVSKPENEAGVGLAFVDIEDSRREELVKFIESGIPEEDDDELLILERDDPMLA